MFPFWLPFKKIKTTVLQVNGMITMRLDDIKCGYMGLVKLAVSSGAVSSVLLAVVSSEQ